VVHKNNHLNFSLFLCQICVNVSQSCRNHSSDCKLICRGDVTNNGAVRGTADPYSYSRLEFSGSRHFWSGAFVLMDMGASIKRLPRRLLAGQTFDCRLTAGDNPHSRRYIIHEPAGAARSRSRRVRPNSGPARSGPIRSGPVRSGLGLGLGRCDCNPVTNS